MTPAQRDAKRRRDAASKRRIRARARGEDPAEIVRSPARRVYLPVAAPTLDLRNAACIGYDPDLWFPDNAADMARAVAICSRCPVRADCQLNADVNGERFGIWAGANREDQRKADVA